MNKYELAVVVSAKLEDDDRAATIERVKILLPNMAAQLQT